MKALRIIISLLIICQLSTSLASELPKPPASTSDVVFEVKELNNSTQTAYNSLKSRESELNMQIKLNNDQRKSASKSKIKSLDKELLTLNNELAATKRILATYPESATNPKYRTPAKPTPTINSNKTQSTNNHASATNNLCYRVLIEVAPAPLDDKNFAGLTDILQQRMPSGQTIYYQGSYATEAEAQRACERIKKCTTFTDAFVVAMRGTQRVSF